MDGESLFFKHSSPTYKATVEVSTIHHKLQLQVIPHARLNLTHSTFR